MQKWSKVGSRLFREVLLSVHTWTERFTSGDKICSRHQVPITRNPYYSYPARGDQTGVDWSLDLKDSPVNSCFATQNFKKKVFNGADKQRFGALVHSETGLLHFDIFWVWLLLKIILFWLTIWGQDILITVTGNVAPSGARLFRHTRHSSAVRREHRVCPRCQPLFCWPRGDGCMPRSNAASSDFSKKFSPTNLCFLFASPCS